VVSAAILGLLLAWLVASIAAQHPAGRTGFVLLRYFTPHWALFTAPIPYLSIVALYRVELPSGAIGEWLPLPAPRPRRWYESLWGPQRRIGKIQGDLAAELVQQRLSGAREKAASSRAYLVFLDQAQAAAAGAPGAVRFCVETRMPGWPADRSRVLFLSDTHPLP
jgi:hypothetical protein